MIAVTMGHCGPTVSAASLVPTSAPTVMVIAPSRLKGVVDQLPKSCRGSPHRVREILDSRAHDSHLLFKQHAFGSPSPIVSFKQNVERMRSPCYLLVLGRVGYRLIHER